MPCRAYPFPDIGGYCCRLARLECAEQCKDRRDTFGPNNSDCSLVCTLLEFVIVVAASLHGIACYQSDTTHFVWLFNLSACKLAGNRKQLPRK